MRGRLETITRRPQRRNPCKSGSMSVALHLKLNELLSSHRAASNNLIGIEDASEEELRRLAAAYLRLSTESDAQVSPGKGGVVEKPVAQAVEN